MYDFMNYKICNLIIQNMQSSYDMIMQQTYDIWLYEDWRLNLSYITI